MVEVMRSLDAGVKAEAKALQLCAAHFARWGSHQYAKETYNKVGDHASLMALHIECEKWEDAFAMLVQHPQYGDKVGRCRLTLSNSC
jgi:intraflagellar transport protein 122